MENNSNKNSKSMHAFANDLYQETPMCFFHTRALRVYLLSQSIEPRILVRPLNTAHCLPNRAIALKTRAECKLPDSVPSPDPLIRFQIGQFIPNAAAGSIAKAL